MCNQVEVRRAFDLAEQAVLEDGITDRTSVEYAIAVHTKVSSAAIAEFLNRFPHVQKGTN
jgi:hypothetical protein